MSNQMWFFRVANTIRIADRNNRLNMVFLENLQANLTRWLSSSESAVSICEKRVLHLSEEASAVACSKWPTVEFITCKSVSRLDENSLDIRRGNSVVITARTLFLLRLSAACRDQSLSEKYLMLKALKRNFILLKRKHQPASRPLIS